ncbi:DMT family transporter [Bradyrhizobium sp. B097]|uniref:DMT family transporter n=1 Tax=Bradyrhizobium sp. B097 TaxID=3140244 RepID=UPI003182EB97
MNVVAPLLFLVMWSSGAIFVKLGLMSSSVWTFLAIRSTGAMLVLAVVLAIGFRSDLRAALMLPRRIILWAVFVGVLLQAGYQGAYFLAIAHKLSPGTLTIILGAQPLLTPFVARERTSWAGKALLLTGFFGLVLAVAGTRELGDGSVLGLTFGVVALAAITVGTALQKQIGVTVARSILWQYIGSVLIFGAIVMVTGWYATPSISFLVSATWMILVVSVGANVLLLYMLSRHPASRVGVVFYFVPIVTLIGEHYIYGTAHSAEAVIGAAIVVLSSLIFAKFDVLLPHLSTRMADKS